MPNIPKGAKTPEDHKTAGPGYEDVDITVGEDEDGNPITRKARKIHLHGLDLVVEERALNDYRVVRLMARARKGDGTAGVEVLDVILGEKQHDQVAAAFADEDGYVDQGAVGNFTVDMFKALAPNS